MAASFPNEDWQLRKSKDGIDIYTRKVNDTSVKSFKAVTSVQTSLSSLIALVKHPEDSKKWIKNCGNAKTIEQLDFWHIVNYYQIDVNLLFFEDRDMVMELDITQDPETLAVDIVMKNVPDYIEEKDGLFRVKILRGSWKLVPRGDSIEITYELLFDPGGNIPAWLANLRVVSDPFNTLKKLHVLSKSEPYRNFRYDEIIEPSWIN